MDYSNPFAQFLNRPQQQDPQMGQQQALIEALRQPQQQQAAPMAAAPMGVPVAGSNMPGFAGVLAPAMSNAARTFAMDLGKQQGG